MKLSHGERALWQRWNGHANERDEHWRFTKVEFEPLALSKLIGNPFGVVDNGL